MTDARVTQTVHIHGRIVTLITDGRVVEREFTTPAEAENVYARYKQLIQNTQGHTAEPIIQQAPHHLADLLEITVDQAIELRRRDAAAPELLEACKALLTAYCALRTRLGIDDISQADAKKAVTLKHQARAAIAKAEGKG